MIVHFCRRQTRSVVLSSIAISLVYLTLTSLLWAQKDAGAIVGLVRDSSGAVVPGAKVTVTDVDRGIDLTLSTDDAGEYVASPLKIGRYRVTVEKQGFKKAVAGPVPVNIQDRVGVDLKLQTGSISETITVTGDSTAGRFSVIDMHIPPGGGPPPHRHDFEETFILLEGEIEANFRGRKSVVRAGDTVNIPANAPQQFHNVSSQPTRLLCICSPAGQENFFIEVGTPVATRTTPPPKLDERQQAEFIQKVKTLAPKYGTELLMEA